MIKKLSELSPGDGGTILRMDGNGAIAQRLMCLAVLPGRQIRVVRFAPLGDPMMIEMGDTVLSLRKREAEHLLIECSDNSGLREE